MRREKEKMPPDLAGESLEETKTLEGGIVAKGLFVDVVVFGSAAEAAGLMVGDQILLVDGQQAVSNEQVAALVQTRSQEQIVALVRRKDQEIEIKITPTFNADLQRFQMGVFCLEKEKIKKERSEQSYECFRREIPYYDAEGKIICTALVDVVDEEIYVGSQTDEKYAVRKLDSFVLVSPEGRPYDLLKHFNIHNLSILIDERVEDAHFAENFKHDEPDAAKKLGDKVVFIGNLNSPYSVAVLLHELTHVEQSMDDRTKKLWDLYGSESVIDRYDNEEKGYEDVQERIEMIVSVLPKVAEGIRPQLEELSQLIGPHDGGGGRHSMIQRQVREMKDYLAMHVEMVNNFNEKQGAYYQDFSFRAHDYIEPPKIKKPGDFLPEQNDMRKMLDKMVHLKMLTKEASEKLMQKLDGWHVEIKRINNRIKELIEDGRMLAILGLPTQIIERDANRGALTNLRQVRKEARIDLLSLFKMPPVVRQANDPLVAAYSKDVYEQGRLLDRQSIESEHDNLITGWIDPSDPSMVITDARRKVRQHMRMLKANPANMRRPDTSDLGYMPQLKDVVSDADPK